MKVLLVNPAKADGPHLKYVTFPNGLLYIAAVLERDSHDVQIYDGNVDRRKAEDFASFMPDIIGFSVVTGPNIADAVELSQKFKELLPETPIVWGGVHPSVLPEQTLREDFIDYVIVGAGEYSLLELVNHLKEGKPRLYEIKGLVYKTRGKIIRNQPRPFIKNLDELPDPAWHLIDTDKYWESTLNTSRGCPFKCTYCYNSGFHNGYRGDFSPERIISQIEYLKKKHNARFIRFFEDNFTFNRKRLKELCQLIIERKIKFHWDCEARADLSEEEISLMAKAGCVSVGLGVETGSPRLLSFLKKGVSLEKVEKSFWLFVKYKIAPRLYIMEGVPTETIEDFILSQKLMDKLDRPPYLYMRFVPYPGTPLFDYCAEKNMITPPDRLLDWAEFITKAPVSLNVSDVPSDMLDEARDDFIQTYAGRRLRFMFRHHPTYFLKMLLKPVEFIRALKSLAKCSLTYNGISKRKAGPLSMQALKSPDSGWLDKYYKHLKWLVDKKTAELREANQNLERTVNKLQAAKEEVSRLYRHEKKLRSDVEKQDKQRIEFTRALVHELKTPLTPILAATELMTTEPLGEPLKSLVTRIERGGRNLERRVDELMDISRGEVGLLKLNCREINLLAVIYESIDYIEPQIEKNGQSLDTELPESLPVVWADGQRLRQVILNLLSNALKFTPRGGRIGVRASVENGELSVEISDTGYGITPEELPQLFKPYHCFKNNGQHFGGLGLGLALSKMLVKLHGGRIWAENRPGKGSTFTFTLPLQSSSTRQEARQSLDKIFSTG